MKKMWAGRTDGGVSKIADDFNSSIHFDERLYKQDIVGSIAHATMLAKCGIITNEEAKILADGLNNILNDIEKGNLIIDQSAEDIHMFVEEVLTERVGDVGKKLHTARSRNDQVALDVRLYLREEIDNIVSLIKELINSIIFVAEANVETVMPGYTHLQRAQPISFAHQLLAYAMMLTRDIGRFEDCKKRLNNSPIGCCALAGTTYPTDRTFEAELLNFDGVVQNSIDGVSDRDFCLEFMSASSIMMMHLSRFSEEIILWTSLEFGFIELDNAYTTGSSIMPQKKNSDMAELVRGKTGRVYGDLFTLLTVLKGLPLAYNKDMQEDKEALFDCIDTIKACLQVFAPMLKTAKVNKDNMFKASNEGFINATDVADYLAKKGVPFREAYKIVGGIVAYCIANKKTLTGMSIEEYKNFSLVFENDLYKEIDLKNCVEKRTSEGGTSFASVRKQIELVKKIIE